jgi:predicted nucleic acid-binding protein
MRRALIDTNAYVAFKKNHPAIVEMMRNLDFIGVNLTVLAELYVGFSGGNLEKKNRKELEEFFNSSRVHFVDHNRDTADFYAKSFHTLKKQGTPIPTNDIWIAASAIQHGLSLITLDKHFSHIGQLILEDLNKYNVTVPVKNKILP